MATSALNEKEIILDCSAGDPRRVQAILADWGLDEATISRMLSEQEAAAQPRGRTRRDTGRALSGLRDSHIGNGNNGNRGSGLHA